MRYAIHYGLTGLWGLVTPLIMIYAMQAALYHFTADNGEIRGHATPMEYLFPFALTGLLAFLFFLLFNRLSLRRVLPEGASRRRHFWLSLLLYFVIAIWGLPALIAVL
ncbi:MAG: hypothetical protein IJ849_11865 [Selenomonadaceae bacterium]|nr:hypothetical protein [Selenomonadaceae bacterium]